jgi:hypothetical protein
MEPELTPIVDREQGPFGGRGGSEGEIRRYAAQSLISAPAAKSYSVNRRNR